MSKKVADVVVEDPEDLSEQDIMDLQDRIDEQMEANGVPSDEDLADMVDRLNEDQFVG